MNLEALGWGALALVLLFWMVGAYNRLMRLRNAIGAAWQQIDALLQRRADALSTLVPLLREPLADEQGTLDALLEAQRQLAAAAEALRRRPASASAARAFIAAQVPWASRSGRLAALVELKPALQQMPEVAAPWRLVQEADARLPFARQAYDDAVQAYNAAAAQWPTRVLSRLFSFKPAAPLQ